MERRCEVSTLRSYFSLGYTLDGTLAYMHSICFGYYSYSQLTSRMRVYFFCCYTAKLLQCDHDFMEGSKQLLWRFKIFGRRCFAKLMKFLFPKLIVFLDRVSGYPLSFMSTSFGSRSFHELRLPFMLILTLIRKYKYMGQSQGKKQGPSVLISYDSWSD